MTNLLLASILSFLLLIITGIVIKTLTRIVRALYKRKPWNCSEHVSHIKARFDEDLNRYERGLELTSLPPGCDTMDVKEVFEMYKDCKQKGEKEALAFCRVVIKMNLKGEL